MEVRDYICDANNDLQIVNGDFYSGDCTQQNQERLMLAEKGSITQFPGAGVGMRSYLLDDESPDSFVAATTEEFESDGMNVDDIIFNSWDDIDIVAEYTTTDDLQA
jgi:hypothetical protein